MINTSNTLFHTHSLTLQPSLTTPISLHPSHTHTYRYDFVPPVKYNYLDADEAEERFERRNKTLNYFSIMLSKKMKDQEEEGGDSKGTGEERGGEEATGSSGSKKWKKKQTGKDTVLVSDYILFRDCS